jgi:8-oxo-dGTP pyrophosphatase MutT (NUDIX family)
MIDRNPALDAALDDRDMPYDPKGADRPRLAPRPKDAATLVLVRRDAAAPRVLMGRRAGGHSFMPDKYVFPGGKVDRADRHAPALDALPDPDAADLRKAGARRDPRAYALAAIRETWEEAGLIVGKAGPARRVRSADPGWRGLLETGATPILSPLRFVARAITPPHRHKRFDARFFMADAEAALLDDRPARDGAEMLDLRWFTWDEAMDLDLPSVTRFVLGEIAHRLARPDVAHAPPFLRWGRKGHVMERL